MSPELIWNLLASVKSSFKFFGLNSSSDYISITAGSEFSMAAALFYDICSLKPAGSAYCMTAASFYDICSTKSPFSNLGD